MKKLLVASIISIVLFSSCEKDDIVPIQQPTQVVIPTPVAQTTTPSYNVIIENSNPTKKIIGLYIDGKLQKLDVGSYPVGYNQKAYAKSHDYICPNVYFPNGCRTLISVVYSEGGSFNSVKISRYKNGRRWATWDGLSGTSNSFNFIFNGSGNNSSTLGVNWGGQGVRPSNDVWTGPIEIIAK